MTRRDLQAAAKQQGRPWCTAKNFPQSAPLSAIVPAGQGGVPSSGAVELRVNGHIRQSGDIADMIWGIPDIIAQLSALYELRPGDLVFTGTPEGVGPTLPGDVLEGAIAGIGTLRITIGEPRA
jgi:fumarylpyruvate hydrolase